jgi:hypothetical protein
MATTGVSSVFSGISPRSRNLFIALSRYFKGMGINSLSLMVSLSLSLLFLNSRFTMSHALQVLLRPSHPENQQTADHSGRGINHERQAAVSPPSIPWANGADFEMDSFPCGSRDRFSLTKAKKTMLQPP